MTDNKQLIHRYFEALTQRDVEAALAMCAEDLVNHAAIPEGQGVAGLRRIMALGRKAFPDRSWSVEDVIAEGDRVACRVKMRGTHTGPLEMTHARFEATNKPFETEHIHIFRLDRGKIVEQWAGRDDFGMMRQLGVVPGSPKVAS
jgi:steroid delta-isomerase-like uncharacterized protein